MDCEGEDLFSVYGWKPKKSGKRQTGHDRQQVEPARQAKDDQQRLRIAQSISDAVAAGQFHAASAIYEKFANELQAGKSLSDQQVLDVVKALQQQKKWEASVPLLVELLSRLSLEQSINVRLKLAQILIQITEQPRQALAVLTKIPKELPEKQRKLRQQLARRQARDRRRKPGSGNP